MACKTATLLFSIFSLRPDILVFRSSKMASCSSCESFSSFKISLRALFTLSISSVAFLICSRKATNSVTLSASLSFCSVNFSSVLSVSFLKSNVALLTSSLNAEMISVQVCFILVIADPNSPCNSDSLPLKEDSHSSRLAASFFTAATYCVTIFKRSLLALTDCITCDLAESSSLKFFSSLSKAEFMSCAITVLFKLYCLNLLNLSCYLFLHCL